MGAFSELQQREFAMQNEGFRAVKHQSFVGVGYFDHWTTSFRARVFNSY